ncbi:hypothetical protein ACIRRH_39345 [Kitasatospora sp. NPDC101235]|uniref:hypothetical protein n=1 Tax=Kitasatospora sp. NPDC101235 TaxID=3364101 RepID=UPI00381BEC8D
MSIRSLAAAAHLRRTPTPAGADLGPDEPRAWAAAEGGTRTATAAATSDTLAQAVPTEVIVLYTTVLGVLTGVLKGDVTATYLPLRWILYGGCIAGSALAFNLTYQLTKTQSAPAPGQGGGQDRRRPEDLPPGEARASAQAAARAHGGAAGGTKPAWPTAETFMACLSFAVWGLVVPGSPLYVELHPPTLPVVVTTLSAVGAFLSVLFTPWLNRKASRS